MKAKLKAAWIKEIQKWNWQLVINPACPDQDNEFSAWKRFHRFVQSLNVKRYNTKNYKRFPELGISTCAFLEKGALGRLHFHILLDDIGSLTPREICQTWLDVGGYGEKMKSPPPEVQELTEEWFRILTLPRAQRLVTETKWSAPYNGKYAAGYISKKCYELGAGKLWRREVVAKS